MTRRAPSDHLPTDMPERPGFPGAPAAERQFGIGQSVHRREDPILVQGQGRYTDDLSLPGQLHAVFVRSPYAHGVLNGVDVSAALDVPGVLGAYTARDLEGYGTFPNGFAFKNADGSTMAKPKRAALATDKVRFVGDPVAFVVAESAAAAREARRPWRSTSSSCPPP